MLQTFKTYQLAVEFHQGCERVQVPSYLRDQLLRASSSVVLNIAEASGRVGPRDRRKYWAIALGSLRESQAALHLCHVEDQSLDGIADQLGACLYRLCHPK